MNHTLTRKGKINQFNHPNCLQFLFALHEKCLYSDLLLFAFSRIRTEYGEILRIYLYSVWMLENTDQNNSEYGHFLRSVNYSNIFFMELFTSILLSSVLPTSNQLKYTQIFLLRPFFLQAKTNSNSFKKCAI